VKLLYGNDDSVCPSVHPSVRPSSFFCWRSNFRTVHNFAILFSLIDSLGNITGQVRYRTQSDDPIRSTAKGHVNFKYKAPSCEISLERYSKGLSNDTKLMGPVTLYDLQRRFKVSQVPHHVWCRWKGLVKSFLTMHEICTQ
jgi:hypothetical protein